ncbi:MAG: type II secretion system protein M [Deltaproteobacteria bacterium]|nr:MAG: type II secretion system protein M [Deltaproteobacteria bacterium]
MGGGSDGRRGARPVAVDPHARPQDVSPLAQDCAGAAPARRHTGLPAGSCRAALGGDAARRRAGDAARRGSRRGPRPRTGAAGAAPTGPCQSAQGRVCLHQGLVAGARPAVPARHCGLRPAGVGARPRHRQAVLAPPAGGRIRRRALYRDPAHPRHLLDRLPAGDRAALGRTFAGRGDPPPLGRRRARGVGRALARRFAAAARRRRGHHDRRPSAGYRRRLRQDPGERLGTAEGQVLRRDPATAHGKGAGQQEGDVRPRICLCLLRRSPGRRLMDRIRAWWTDARAWLAAASPRERRLITLAGGGVLLFAVLITYASFSAAIRRAETALDEKRADFEKISRLAAGYGALEQERQLLEARLRQSPPALMTFVDTTARNNGVDVGGMSDRGVVAGGQNGRPREMSVEVNLGKVPLDKLVKLIAEIERSPGVVRVRRLRLRKAYESKDLLDVSLTVSAWQGS